MRLRLLLDASKLHTDNSPRNSHMQLCQSLLLHENSSEMGGRVCFTLLKARPAPSSSQAELWYKLAGSMQGIDQGRVHTSSLPFCS